MLAFLGRIIVFFITISLIRSVVTAVLGAFRGNSQGPGRPVANNSSSGAQPGGGGADASTLLHQDPVCGTYVAAGSSFRKVCKGQVVHFCSEACRDRYAA